MRAIYREGLAVKLIDQTRLPRDVVLVECTSDETMCEAIRSMRIRGAPALGIAAAYGMALGAEGAPDAASEFVAHLNDVANRIRATRPTAVNLFRGVDLALAAARAAAPAGVAAARAAVWKCADRMATDESAIDRRMGDLGATLVPDGARILTHCNAGALATVDWGTALGVVRSAVRSGKAVHVYVDETRPFLQGSRLTSWELKEEGIPHTVISDNMAGYLMAQGEIDLCIVGADRIAASGDVANKIGTYTVAVLADVHRLPFYVAAPTSTIDLATETGAEIPVEERDPSEVLSFAGVRVAPEGVAARHPAFDVTPSRYVTAIMTEVGVLRPPYEQTLAAAVEQASTKPQMHADERGLEGPVDGR